MGRRFLERQFFVVSEGFYRAFCVDIWKDILLQLATPSNPKALNPKTLNPNLP